MARNLSIPSKRRENSYGIKRARRNKIVETMEKVIIVDANFEISKILKLYEIISDFLRVK
jgi:hypothetical protein